MAVTKCRPEDPNGYSFPTKDNIQPITPPETNKPAKVTKPVEAEKTEKTEKTESNPTPKNTDKTGEAK